MPRARSVKFAKSIEGTSLWSALWRGAGGAAYGPALTDVVIGNAEMAPFAAFGSFALLLLVDFTGPIRARMQAQAGLVVTGAIFVCVGTLASRWTWVATAGMVLGAVAIGAGLLAIGYWAWLDSR